MMNKVIVVIGASRGIGRELVLQFAHDKTNKVYALSRNIEKMKTTFTQENIVCSKIDLLSDNLHDELNHIFKNVKQIDILVNNAGVLIKKPFLELTKEDLNISYQTNSIGLIHATQYFVSKMLEKGGHIVNISTMGAYQGSVKFPELVSYTSSKAGLTTFTELFAEEFKDTKVKMNCLCLGAVQTEMFQEAFPEGKAPLSASQMAEYIVDFSYNGANYFNGKILPVNTSTP